MASNNTALGIAIKAKDKADSVLLSGDTVTLEFANPITLPSSQNAQFTNLGNNINAVIQFGIPAGHNGHDGENGDTGEKGEQGEKGEIGKSAYEIALDNGFTGSVSEWLESLKGKDGFGFSPHLWTTNEEIDIGDGSFGRRFIGSITASLNTAHTVKLVQQNLKLVDCGGWWYPSTSTRAQFPSVCGTSNSLKVECEIRWTSSEGLFFYSFTSGTRNNTPYDIWIRYTK